MNEDARPFLSAVAIAPQTHESSLFPAVLPPLGFRPHPSTAFSLPLGSISLGIPQEAYLGQVHRLLLIKHGFPKTKEGEFHQIGLYMICRSLLIDLMGSFLSFPGFRGAWPDQSYRSFITCSSVSLP